MKIELKYEQGTLIAKISGEIDHHTADSLRERLDCEIESRSVKKLILDFEEVSFMDSSGIGVIVGRYKRIDALGGEMRIINQTEQVDKILEISGIKKILRCGKEVMVNE